MTGSTDNTQILSPARANVYLAPVGSVAPATSSEALDPAWVNVGLTTPDSLGFQTQPQFQSVNSHQSDYPTRQIQTSESADLSVELQQWNTENLVGVYGGGSVTQPDATNFPGEYKFVPPTVGGRQEKAAIIEVIDGTKTYRWVYPRTMQIDGVQQQFHKGQESRLPLHLSILGDDGVEPFYLLTNDPAFA